MKLAAPVLALLATTAATTAVGCTDGAAPPAGDDPAFALAGGKADSSWCHNDFQSSEGTQIRVDYQLPRVTDAHGGFVVKADPLWINAQRSDLGSANAIHVWIGDETYSSKEGYDTAAGWNSLSIGPDANLDLYRSPDDDRFTAQLTAGLLSNVYVAGDDQVQDHAHQFAIVIDGAWQTDPISNTHNFLVKSMGCQ